MRQPNGPNYEFFSRLLPPLRYVNAAFRHYPIVLSAPGSAQKARLVSNGSAINARANLKTWRDPGTPVTFRLGDDHQLFGEDGLESMVDRVASIEKTLSIYELAQFTPRI